MSPEPSYEELRQRLDTLEKWAKEHSGPERGKTSLNFPHTGIVYLDEDGLISSDLLPASGLTEAQAEALVAAALYYL